MRRALLSNVSKDDLMKIRSSLEYWLGIDSEKLLKNPNEFIVEYARTGKIRRLFKKINNEELLYFTFRPYDFYPVPTIHSGKELNNIITPIKRRVVVDDDQIPYIKEKKSILNSLVVDIDEDLRNGDYVLIVDKSIKFLGIGKLKISPQLIKESKHGFGIIVKDVE